MLIAFKNYAKMGLFTRFFLLVEKFTAFTFDGVEKSGNAAAGTHRVGQGCRTHSLRLGE